MVFEKKQKKHILASFFTETKLIEDILASFLSETKLICGFFNFFSKTIIKIKIAYFLNDNPPPLHVQSSHLSAMLATHVVFNKRRRRIQQMNKSNLISNKNITLIHKYNNNSHYILNF